MAFSVMESVNRASTSALKPFLLAGNTSLSLPFSAAKKPSVAAADYSSYNHISPPDDEDYVPTSGISWPLSEILKVLNKKVPDSLVKVRTESNGFSIKHIPCFVKYLRCAKHFTIQKVDGFDIFTPRHIVNRIMNLHAPEWSGEVRSITYSADGKCVSVVYRVTIYGTDAEIYRESTRTASVAEAGYGDPVQKAESMAFCRACARFGLGLHLYHEDMM